MIHDHIGQFCWQRMLEHIYWQNANMAGEPQALSWPGFKGFSREGRLIFKDFFLSRIWNFQWVFLVECSTDYYYQASENIWLKRDFSAKKANSVPIPWRNEFMPSCHPSIPLCLDIVNSVFVSEQYITYWIHFGYLPCRWNSDEEIWNISSKRKDSTFYMSLREVFNKLCLLVFSFFYKSRWISSPSCVHH